MTEPTVQDPTIEWMEKVAQAMIAALVERQGDEVDLVFAYGSQVKGNTHRYSDLDFSFVPRKEPVRSSITVLVNGTLFDLYPMPWSRLEEMARFENVSSTVLLSNRVLYARDAETSARFHALADDLRERLKPEARPQAIQSAQRLFQRTGPPYLLLRLWAKEQNTLGCLQQAHTILRTVFHCLAVANQACIDTRKIEQVCALAQLPQGFSEMVTRCVQSSEPAAHLAACEELLHATRRFLAEQSRPSVRQPATFPNVCRAVYPEMRAALDKLLVAAERGDMLMAKICVISTLEELMIRVAQVRTGETFTDFHGAGDYEQDLDALGFPALLPPLETGDWPELRVRASAFDQRLRQFLTENGVMLNDFADLTELCTALDRQQV